jgi:hypothetical protein
MKEKRNVIIFTCTKSGANHALTLSQDPDKTVHKIPLVFCTSVFRAKLPKIPQIIAKFRVA